MNTINTQDAPEFGPQAITAFMDDLTYIQAELQWIELRALRITAERRLVLLEDEEAPQQFQRNRYEDQSPRQLYAQSKRLREREEDQRTWIDDCRRVQTPGPPLALDALCERCNLDDFQRMIILLAVAPCFSQRYEALYGRVTGKDLIDSLTVEVAFTFAELTFADRVRRRSDFSARSPLIAQDLVTVEVNHRFRAAKDLLGADIEINRRTLGFVLGRNELADEFLEFSSVEEPRADLNAVVLDPGVKARLLSVVDQHEQYLIRRKAWGLDEVIQYGRGSMMLFYGPPGTGKTMTAHGIAHHIGKRILNVDIPTFLEHAEADRFLPGLFREARFQDAVLFFDECECLFASRRQGNQLMTLLLTELERFEGIAIFATNLPDVLDEAFARRLLLRLPFAEPDAAARAAIWQAHLPSTVPLALDVDLTVLAKNHELAGGYIKNAVLAAVAASVYAGSKEQLTMAQLDSAARDQSVRIGSAMDHITVPDARLSHVVLSEDNEKAVGELIAAARCHSTLSQRWHIGGQRMQGGLAALFYGPAGTGKTYCAEAIAGELNRPLRRVRSSTLLSKYVGDSERRLEAIFADARSEDSVLLIDEADSLLLKRGQGDNRHDRSLVNLLLDLIERHKGLVLLATNHAADLDEALERRLAYSIGFERPNAVQRAAIWRQVLPVSEYVESQVDLDAMADGYPLSGAEIKRVAMGAGVRAYNEDRSISQKDLEDFASQLDYQSRNTPIGFMGPRS
jgi:SpoVK/Ycf46/Vps4 family AAA+-type ATPase